MSLVTGFFSVKKVTKHLEETWLTSEASGGAWRQGTAVSAPKWPVHCILLVTSVCRNMHEMN